MNYIRCPKCGYEYHPSEIFIPTAVIGKPHFIERDNNGCITNVIADNTDYTESYRCDNCNNLFSITMKCDYEIEAVSEMKDCSSDYTTKLQ